MIDPAIVEKEAMQLSDIERAILADKLLSSLPRPTAERRAVWAKEAASRLQAYRDGHLSAEDGETAMAKLRARYSK